MIIERWITMRKRNLKKFLSLFVLSLWCLNTTLPVLAASTSGVVFDTKTDGYGATILGMTGSSFDKKSATETTINTTGKVGTVTWLNLNIRKDEKLNYSFEQAGAVSLNNVLSGMSKFAGAINTIGENAGHVIIANSNGMMFLDGASVNMTNGSSLTLAANNMIYNPFNGSITSVSSSDKGIVIGQGAGDRVVFNVGKDLNIIAPGTMINNADIAAGNIRLVSADGVNFVAQSTNPTIIKSTKIAPKDVKYGTYSAKDIKILGKTVTVGKEGYEKSQTSAITINNSNLSATKQADGKITISGNGVDIYNSELTNNGRGDLVSTGNTTVKNSTVENSDVTSTGAVLLEDSKIFKSTITANKGLNIRGMGNDGALKSVIDDSTIIINGGNIVDGISKDVEITTTTINDSQIINNSSHQLVFDYSKINHSDISAKSSVLIRRSSLNNNSTVSTTGQNSLIRVDSGGYALLSEINDSILSTSGDYAKIDIDSVRINNSKLSTAGKSEATGEWYYDAGINIANGSIITNGSKLTTTGDNSKITINNSVVEWCNEVLTTGNNSEIVLSGANTSTNYSTFTTTGDDSGITVKDGAVVAGNSTLLTEGEKSGIDVKDGAIIQGGTSLTTTKKDSAITINKAYVNHATITTKGDNSAITIKDGNEVIGEFEGFYDNFANTYLTKGDNSSIVVDNSYVNYSIGEGETADRSMITEGNGSSIDVINNSTVRASYLITKGAGSDINVVNSVITGGGGSKSILETNGNKIYVRESSTIEDSKIAVTNGTVSIESSEVNNSTIDAYDGWSIIELSNSNINNSTVTKHEGEGYGIFILGSTLNNTTVINDCIDSFIRVDNLYGLVNSTIQNGSKLITNGARSNIIVTGASTVNNSELTVNAVGPWTSNLSISSGSTVNNSKLTTNGVTWIGVENSTVNGSELTANGEWAAMAFYGATINGGTITKTTADGGGIIIINGSTLNDVTVDTNGKSGIEISNGSTINKSKLFAKGDDSVIHVSKSTITDSTLKTTGNSWNGTSNDAKIKVEGSVISGSTLDSATAIWITVLQEPPVFYPVASEVTDSIIKASYIVIGGTLVEDSLVISTGDYGQVELRGAEVNSTQVSTNGYGSVIYIDNSTLNDSEVTAKGMNSNIKVYNNSMINKTKLLTGKDNSNIIIDNSTVSYSWDGLTTNGENSNIEIIKGSTIDHSSLSTNGEGSKINVDASKVNASYLTTEKEGSEINITNCSNSGDIFDLRAITKGTNSAINVENSSVLYSGLTTVGDESKIVVKDSFIGYGWGEDRNKLITNGKNSDISVLDSIASHYLTLETNGEDADIVINNLKLEHDLTANAKTGSVTLIDVTGTGYLISKTGKDINILGSNLNGAELNAKNVTIANSTKTGGDYNFYSAYAEDRLTTTDISDAKGYAQGTGTPSVINGNLKVNADSLTIANTHVKGDLGVNAENTNTNIIYSVIDNGAKDIILSYGTNNNVLKSYIGEWTRTPPFIHPPVTPPPLPPRVKYDRDNYSKLSNSNNGDPNRLKLAEDIDTTFRQQFNPRGFAAGDDELKQMKNSTLAGIIKKETGAISLTKGFRAY